MPTDSTIALREELRQWKRALGWWSGMPAQDAYDLWRHRRRDAADPSSETSTEGEPDA